jgi:WD40 repeat protein
MGGAEERRPSLREIRLEKLSAAIEGLDLAAGSDLAVVATSNRRVRVWRLGSGQTVHEFAFPEPETDARQKSEKEVEPIRVRFAPDGGTLAVSYLSRLYFYSVSEWKQIQSVGVAGEDTMRPRPTPTLARRVPSEETTRDASGPTPNQYIQEWALLQMQGDGRTRITDFSFTRDGSSILAAYCKGGCYDWASGLWNAGFPSGNDPVRLWDVGSGQLIWERVLDPKKVVERVVLSPDGASFAAAQHQPGRCRVEVRALGTGETRYSLPEIGYPFSLPPLILTPDGQYLITFRPEEGDLKHHPSDHLVIYEASSGKFVAELPGRYAARHADLSPDGRWLVTSADGVRFRIWDVQRRKAVVMTCPREWLWSGPPIESVRFSPDGHFLIVASDTSGMLAVYQFGP